MLTATAVLSVAMGIISLVVVMSVMRGFRKELATRLVGFNSHIILTKGHGADPLDPERIKILLEDFELKGVSPFVQGEVIARSDAAGETLAQGARVRGIDPDNPGAMKGIDYLFPTWIDGSRALERPHGNGLPGAIIGSEIVSQLMVHPDFRDTVELVAPLAELGPAGELVPNQERFLIVGIFRAGFYDYDSKYILVPIDEARRLLGMQATEGLNIRLADVADAPEALSILKSHLPEGWSAAGWNEQNKKLFAALKLERIAMGGVLLMVILIASFSIVGTIHLVTSAKRRDIAILASIGKRRASIRRIFVYHAAFIGVVGSGLGLIGGLVICLAIERWPIRLPESYYLDWLPVDLNPLVAFAFAIAGVAIALLASLYPVRQATRLKPVEVLRYE